MLRYGSFSIIFTAIFWQGKWAGFILGAEERGKNFDTVVSKKKKKRGKQQLCYAIAAVHVYSSLNQVRGELGASWLPIALWLVLVRCHLQFLHFISWQLILACIIHIYGTALGHPWPRLWS